MEAGWKLRLPRELPHGNLTLAVSLVDVAANRRLPTESGSDWVELPIEVVSD